MNQKIAVVTGGTKGIGCQIVKELLVRGYYVFTNYASDDSTARKAQAEFAVINDTFEIIRADQADKEQVNKFIHTIKKKIKQSIDCIVCNAAVTVRKPMIEIMDTEWEKIMQVNVTAHFSLIRDLYHYLRNNSRIIFIGSILGSLPHAISLPYGVSKSALHGLAKNLVKDFEDTGTTVNIVAPGFVETEMHKDKPQEIRENIYRKTAVKRFADVKEIASAVMFCLDNAYINGSLIEINGGYCFK